MDLLSAKEGLRILQNARFLRSLIRVIYDELEKTRS